MKQNITIITAALRALERYEREERDTITLGWPDISQNTAYPRAVGVRGVPASPGEPLTPHIIRPQELKA